MIDRLEDAKRHKEIRRENKKNNQILHDLLLQLIHQPKPKDTIDTLAISELCATISLIDQIRIEERANQQAKSIILVTKDNEY